MSKHVPKLEVVKYDKVREALLGWCKDQVYLNRCGEGYTDHIVKDLAASRPSLTPATDRTSRT